MYAYINIYIYIHIYISLRLESRIIYLYVDMVGYGVSAKRRRADFRGLAGGRPPPAAAFAEAESLSPPDLGSP